MCLFTACLLPLIATLEYKLHINRNLVCPLCQIIVGSRYVFVERINYAIYDFYTQYSNTSI